MMDSRVFVDQALQSYQSSQMPSQSGNANRAVRKMNDEQINTVAEDFEAFFQLLNAVSYNLMTMPTGVVV